jgi:replication factor A1
MSDRRRRTTKPPKKLKPAQCMLLHLMFLFFSLVNSLVAKVSELEPETNGYNLKVKVSEVKIVMDKTGFDGKQVRIAEALIGDESASVLLTARNGKIPFFFLILIYLTIILEQIDILETGKSLIIRNAKVEMFKNHMRLAVDKWGLIEAVNPPFDFTIASEPNLSTVEYELVEDATA